MNLTVQKRRLAITMTVNVVAFVVAGAAILGSWKLHLGWPMEVVLAVALIAGFAAQTWLVVGVIRDRSPT